MLAAAWREHAPASPIATLVAGMVSDPVPAPTSADVERTADGLVLVVDEVRTRAPRARIVLVDYLTAISDRTVAGRDVPFPAADLTQARRIQAALREAHLVAADRSGAELLSASSLSETHALGDPAPWVFGFFTDLDRIGASFHPNAEGMAAVAEGLRELLG
ncbi:GDSL-type esterase/lipase family protein [Gordonia sp. SL306]|uniref:GDSL-type esterase/lipase family protein n=1 Tax=Gordonia sp. SL306 TaxID=2995145 RepID=UPI002D1E3E90|nr:GDSL-type esterase/lipase family protein [Gordonia sp. SL306]